METRSVTKTDHSNKAKPGLQSSLPSKVSDPPSTQILELAEQWEWRKKSITW